jgi:hypothetical protein
MDFTDQFRPTARQSNELQEKILLDAKILIEVDRHLNDRKNDKLANAINNASPLEAAKLIRNIYDLFFRLNEVKIEELVNERDSIVRGAIAIQEKVAKKPEQYAILAKFINEFEYLPYVQAKGQGGRGR